MNQNIPLARWKWITWGVFLFCFGCAPIVTVQDPTQTQINPSPTLPTVTMKVDDVATVSEPTPSRTPDIHPSPTSQIVMTATDEVKTVSVHDPDIRTGLDEIDQVIDTVLGGDISELRQRIRFTTTGCTHADGLGGPPKCKDGESEGTLVEVLPFLGPEGHFLRKSEINEWQGVDVSGLYAVYRVAEEAYADKDYPAGEYGIVFATPQWHTMVTLQAENGSILRIDYKFGNPPAINFDRDAEEIILPPPS
jgi:hypothetical protein